MVDIIKSGMNVLRGASQRNSPIINTRHVTGCQQSRKAVECNIVAYQTSIVGAIFTSTLSNIKPECCSVYEPSKENYENLCAF